jgi:hypothetical protein
MCRKITVRELRTQMRNPDYVECDFTGHTDLIVVRYAVTDSDLPINSRLRSLVKVTDISRV